jgi:RNA polymerase sigma factor (sigma-70 family)
LKLTDRQLVEACLENQRSAQYELYNRFSPKLFAVAIRYLKDKEEAKDALQVAFIKAFEHLKSFRFDCPLEAWLRRIVINTSIRTLQSRKQWIGLDGSDSDYVIDKHASEQNLGLENLKMEQLMEVIHSLPEGCQMVFSMFAIDGYKHQEIAEILEISEGTSKSQYSRAKELIIKKLNKENHKLTNVSYE